MSYYILNISLENCPHSIAATEILKIHNIKHENIIVNNTNKNIYKSNKINTFPQIYLRRENKNGSLLLGGCSDLKFAIENFKQQKYDTDKVEKFMKKYEWSKKAVLRLIELLTSINSTP
jgi:glutaredoxin